MDMVCVTIDCSDVEKVATFWSRALGWSRLSIARDGTGGSCRPTKGGTYIEFIRVPEEKLVKNRVHLGCTAGPIEALDDEVARLRALGATVAWEEKFPAAISRVYRNIVLRDVEGNEFCLSGGALPGH